MMRVLLACLMCEILPISQAWAIDGGPFDGGGRNINTIGTYAGLLVPIQVQVDPGPPPVFLPPDNSLALFTLSIPSTSTATGTAAVFRNGYSYSGTITGLADPDNARLTGLVSTNFTRNQTEVLEIATGLFVIRSVPHTYEASGQFSRARIVASSPGSSSVARIRGRATLTYQTDAHDPNCTPSAATSCPVDPLGVSGGPLQYKIRGFKQSNTPTASTPVTGG